MDTFIFKSILVFLAVVLGDILCVLYIRRSGEGRALSAAVFGTLIWIFGAFVVINYMEDKRLIIFAVLGAFIGTYLAVKFDSKK